MPESKQKISHARLVSEFLRRTINEVEELETNIKVDRLKKFEELDGTLLEYLEDFKSGCVDGLGGIEKYLKLFS